MTLRDTLTADLATLFSEDDFAVSAIYTEIGGAGPVTISGIFDDGDVREDGGSVDILVHHTRFTCKASDVADNPEDDLLAVNGKTYVIREVEDDGTGVAVLYLRDQT